MQNRNTIFGFRKGMVNFVHNIMLGSILYSSFFATSQEMVVDYFNSVQPLKYKGYEMMNHPGTSDTMPVVPTSPAKAVNTVLAPVVNTVISGKMPNSIKADIDHGAIGSDLQNPLDNVQDNIFKFKIADLAQIDGKVYLNYELYGVQDLSGVSRSINARPATGGYIIKTQNGWSHQKEEISKDWLHEGENQIAFGILPGANQRYEVKNLSITFEKNKSNSISKVLVVNTPNIQYAKNDQLYVKGFLNGEGLKDVKVFIENTPLSVNNGEYEGFITLTDALKTRKFAMIKAYDSNGLLGQELVTFDYLMEADKLFAVEKHLETAMAPVSAEKGATLDVDGATITVLEGALKANTPITITRLRKVDIAPMASGMVNVTKGGNGYRFLPDGIRFEKPIPLAIEYDEKLIPPGHTPNDIKIFYFNTDSKNWVAIERDSIDTDKKSIVSHTNHFTDYINGIIQAPESPETAGFTPTMMNDIKAADPSAEMTLISPPEVSQKGDANVSYPIKIPAGRKGMQPQFVLQYNNEAGNGLTGQGWNISVPAITIDTRWGVPIMSPDLETEIYTLNGEQLMYPKLTTGAGAVDWMPNRHFDQTSTSISTNPRPRITNAVFTPRKQGSFTKIQRLGNSPSDYYWKVTSPDGTINWYGASKPEDYMPGAENGQGNAVLRNAEGKIVHWGLIKTQDVHGNNIKYVYYNATLDITSSTQNLNLHNGKVFHIKNVIYTGFKDIEQGKYEVQFLTTGDVNTQNIKSDASMNARLGIKQVDPYLLSNIIVRNKATDAVIRKYTLNYELGRFRKNRLMSVAESAVVNDQDVEFYRHTFDYYNDIPTEGNDSFFSAGIDVNICDDSYVPCLDTDRDGVCDENDHCVNVPGPVSNHGCPETIDCYTAKIPISQGMRFFMDATGIEVSVNGYELPEGPFSDFNDIVAAMQVHFPVTTYANQYLTISNNPQVFVNIVFYNTTDWHEAFTFEPCPGEPKPRLKDYPAYFRSQTDNYTYEYNGVIPIGNPDCPSFINYDFLIQGYIPSFDSSLSVLGSSLSESESYGAYFGIGVGCKPHTKSATFGVAWSWSKDKTASKVAMIDINGDGLDDVVLEQNGFLYFKAHHVDRTYNSENEPVITHTFGNKRPISGINNFYRANGSSKSTNFQLTVGIHKVGGFFGLDGSKSEATTNVFFSDGNGDGLTDIVKNGVVYFNRLDHNENPVFTNESLLTENMVVKAETMQLDEPADVEPDVVIAPYDVVKVWEAPADGYIKITNDITLTDPTQQSLATIEMKQNEPAPCLSVNFPTPHTKWWRYYGNYFNISSMEATVYDSCYLSSVRFWSLTDDLNVAHTALPENIFIVHGDDTNPSVNRCPSYPITSVHDFIVQNPFCNDKTEAWMEDVLTDINVPHNSILSNHSAYVYQPANPDSGVATISYINFMFYSTDDDLEFSYQNQGATAYPYPNGTLTWNIIASHDFDRNDFPSIVNHSANIFVNGSPMVGNPYNIGGGFAAFKSAFESQYPESTVTLASNAITITTSNPGIISIKIIEETSGEIHEYFFSDCNVLPRQQENLAQHWKNVVPSKSAMEYARNKWTADGNEAAEPFSKVELHMTYDFTNNKKNPAIKGIYFLDKNESSFQWFDEKQQAITDRKMIVALNDLLPDTVDNLYKTFVDDCHKTERDKRIKNQRDSQAWLESQNPKQARTNSETASVNPTTCANTTNPLCLLLEVPLNSTTSTFSNSILQANAACGGGDLYVRKGDRIYFRVHAMDGENPAVEWDPYIEYTNPAMAAMKDQNQVDLYKSSYSDGFILSGNRPVTFPGNQGTATIEWPSFDVDFPSDTVVYEVHKVGLVANENNDNMAVTDQIIYTLTCTANQNNAPVTATGLVDIPVGLGGAEASMAVTQFYFKVITSSNIDWKNHQWRPKITCRATMPVAGESGPEGEVITHETLYPVVDYPIYKSYPCSPKYALLDVTTFNNGIGLGIKPYINNPFSDSDPDGVIWFVVKCDGKLIDKRKLTVTHDWLGHIEQSLDETAAIPLTNLTSNNIEIGYYAEDMNLFDSQPSLLSKLILYSGPSVKISYGGNWHDVPDSKVNYYQRPNPKFGPMLSQWGQFLYNPAAVAGAVAPTYDDMINESVLFYTQAQALAIQTAVNNMSSIDANANDAVLEGQINSFQAANGGLVNTALLVANPIREEAIASEKWIGFHEENYASAIGFRAASMNESFGSGFDPEPYEFQNLLYTGAYGINKISRGTNRNISGGINIDIGVGTNIGGNASKTLSGNNSAVTDYIDFNGDRYPDIVTSERVQFTNRTGGLTLPKDRSGNLTDSKSSGFGMGSSASFSKGGDGDGDKNSDGADKLPRFQGFRGNSGGSLSGNFSHGTSRTNGLWSDMNGDGLADRIAKDGNDVEIDLNLGYANEGTEYKWNIPGLFYSEALNISAGTGISKWTGSFELGLSITTAWNNTQSTLIDMNGDGLLDFVNGNDNIKVTLNTGNKFFAFDQQWSSRNLKRESASVGAVPNATVSFSLVWTIPTIPPFCLKIPTFSASASKFGTTANKTKKIISDFDGDGYPDIIEQVGGNTLRVYSSKIRRTDMLKSVTNPLGGKFTIDYKVQPVNYGSSEAKWAMTEVKIEDGYNKINDGRDVYVKRFVYENGKYDRRERAFYGYATVKTQDYTLDELNKPVSVYRTSVDKYYNESYFLNGLLKESYTAKGDDETKLFSRTENFYEIKQLNNTNSRLSNPAASLAANFDVGGSEGRRSAAVVLAKTKNYLYELSPTPLITTEAIMTYDVLARVSEYTNNGDLADATDNYSAKIEYHEDLVLISKHIMNAPSSISVFMGGNQVRRRETKIDFNNGNVTLMRALISDSPALYANTSMKYDQYGNLVFIAYPKNSSDPEYGNAASRTYEYKFDDVYHKYVEKITDAFGYSSFAYYHPNFDKIVKTIDMAGNSIIYEYDVFGRNTIILAPKELGQAEYTIKSYYFPNYADIVNNPEFQNCLFDKKLFVPVALTRHYDPQHPENKIETITFMDGLSRPIQIKKDIELNKGDHTEKGDFEAMSVSGKIWYDEFGRMAKQFHPCYEDKDCKQNLVFNVCEVKQFSSIAYDEIDRQVKTVDPDSNTTATKYTIEADEFGKIGMKTATDIDQNGAQHLLTESYTNVLGNTYSVNNIGDSEIWTKFGYNAIGELMYYTDNASQPDALTTTYTYNLLGRKTSVTNPDSGTTRYEYDNAGNLIRLQTANLAANDQVVKYKYDIDKLISITYPQLPNGDPNTISNVIYKYGSTGNETGRLIFQMDGSGTQEFEYGNMGEVTHNKRTIVGPNIPTRVFDTYFDYDSWNRLQQMSYPDGEKVFYFYNYGANLKRMTGEVFGQTYDYSRRIEYDYFEQRVYEKYGNNTETSYQYTDGQRRLSNLSVTTPNQQYLFKNTYKYDKVGNVLSIDNQAPPSNTMGGSYQHSFEYDKFNRLKTASGNFDGDPAQEGLGNDFKSDYSLNMAYNNTHGIVVKDQKHNKNGLAFAPNTYHNDYKYEDVSHRLLQVADSNTGNVEEFKYDYDGNITDRFDNQGNYKGMYWDEANRLRVINEANQMQHYIYDGSGQRVLKATTDYQAVYENGTIVPPTNITFNPYTTYASAFMVLDPYGNYSKHYYEGSQRIVSRIGEKNNDYFNQSQDRHAASDEAPDFQAIKKAQIDDLQRIVDKTKKGKVLFKEYKTYSYEELEKMMQEEDTNAETKKEETSQRAANHAVYFYHSDHIGTTTFLTDINGNAYQFFLNLPFGETMAEQLPSTYFATPYKFNGKERDSETGYYYFGARYYDPKTSIWLGVDPMFGEFPNVNPYVYCFDSPLRFHDPTGMYPDDTEGEPAIRNILIVLDYDPKTNPPDKDRDTITFRDMKKNNWVGIYADNIQDAEKKLAAYLKGAKADNILVKTHGSVNSAGESIMYTDNSTLATITSTDMKNFAEGNCSGLSSDTINDINALVNIAASVRDGKNFILGSCHTASNDDFLGSLQIMTASKFDIFGSSDVCSTYYYKDPKKPGAAIYDGDEFVGRDFIDLTNLKNGAKRYKEGAKAGDSPIILKNLQINRNGVKAIPK